MTHRLEMQTEEARSKTMATVGVPTLPKEPEFARKEFSVGVDIATPGVVGGLTGLHTMRDPRAQLRENKMAELASISPGIEPVWMIQEGMKGREMASLTTDTSGLERVVVVSVFFTS